MTWFICVIECYVDMLPMGGFRDPSWGGRAKKLFLLGIAFAPPPHPKIPFTATGETERERARARERERERGEERRGEERRGEGDFADWFEIICVSPNNWRLDAPLALNFLDIDLKFQHTIYDIFTLIYVPGFSVSLKRKKSKLFQKSKIFRMKKSKF